jgi:hypothetical protein
LHQNCIVKESTEPKTNTNNDSVVSELANGIDHSEEDGDPTGASERPVEASNSVGKKRVHKFKIFLIFYEQLSRPPACIRISGNHLCYI